MKREIADFLFEQIKDLLELFGIPEETSDRFYILIMSAATIAVIFTVTEITYRIIAFIIRRIIKKKRYLFLSNMLERHRLRRLVYIIPPMMINIMLPLIISHIGEVVHYIKLSNGIYTVVAFALAINGTLNALGESVFTNSKYHDRPVKGFIQISKAVVYVIAAIIIISILTNKSPLYLIGGLGAFAAVVMLVAKDSIMGFVGGFLLLENDMVRLGDWIEIPGTSINGSVSDISLTIVKVRNWDNTIATIPPYDLINGSFINWRGMSESGGRRIARGYTVKLDNIKPCSDTILRRLKKIDSELANYIIRKAEQSLKGNVVNTANPEGLTNGSIDTNAGLFRAYADMYLRRHPMIRKDMMIMVRTMEPNENGLPIQFYCFTKVTEWRDYESIQSEIMEHFASVMPIFELYPFQSSGARDTIISGMLEGNYPIERIDGLPYGTVK